MMGYCPNEWVSDYTYNALFERITAIRTEKKVLSAQSGSSASLERASRYRIASVGAAGELTWDGASEIDLDDDITGGSVVSARFLSASGAEMATRSARFYRFDHLPGGFLFVPQETSLQWKSLRVDGYPEQLTR